VPSMRRGRIERVRYDWGDPRVEGQRRLCVSAAGGLAPEATYPAQRPRARNKKSLGGEAEALNRSLRCGAVRCGAVQCGAMRRGAKRCGASRGGRPPPRPRPCAALRFVAETSSDRVGCLPCPGH
jgi:hypothetical protein